MKTILFAFPGNEALTQKLLEETRSTKGEFGLRRFPDGESLVTVQSNVSGMRAVIVCSLDQPDDKVLPLYFLCSTLRELGAQRVELIAPYLSYMRQDKRFHPGEALTSDAFAKLLSKFIDRLVTVDPHLHRHHTLSEIYSVPTCVVHAAEVIAQWIKQNISDALLIGPDEESRQWVEAVALAADAPFEVLQKDRKGDHDVGISLPHVEKYKEHTPVLVDDIISTANTMIETISHLRHMNMKPAICIGVHAVFAGDAYQKLSEAGAGKIVTCNTIHHATNQVDLSHQLSVVL